MSRDIEKGHFDAPPHMGHIGVDLLHRAAKLHEGAVMPYEEAVEMLKKSIKKMYGKKAWS